MKQLIAISAIGNDRTGLVYDLTRVVVDCGGNILESRMTALGNEFAMLLLVVRQLAHARQARERAHQARRILRADAHRASHRDRPPRTDMVTYTADVVCLDQPGVLHALSGFFSSRGIDIGDISTRTYNAAHTGAPMFSVYMVVHVPTRIHIAALREEFMDLCDHMNLDAILEPMKA